MSDIPVNCRNAGDIQSYLSRNEDNNRVSRDKPSGPFGPFGPLAPKRWIPEVKAAGSPALLSPALLSQRKVRVVEHAHVRIRDGVTVFPVGVGKPRHDKRLPYYSERYVAFPGNLNTLLPFAGGSTEADIIACRHLAVRFIAEARATAKLLPHRLFGNKELVAKNVTRDTEAEFERMTQEASAKHIVSNDRFGHHLATFFRGMQSGEKKHFLICSCNHAMAFELHRKPGNADGHDEYVVRFFDPNRTDIKIRCQLDDPGGFECNQYALRHFLGDRYYREYFGVGERESILFDCTDAVPAQSRVVTLETGEEHDLSEILLYHLLVFSGDQAAFDVVRQRMEAIPDVMERRRLLKARDADGVSGLHMALQDNRAVTIEAFATLLKALDLGSDGRDAFLGRLLEARDPGGVPGLFLALQTDGAAAIKAYTMLLKVLDLGPEARIPVLGRLLEARRPDDGTTGLTMALQGNRVAGIEAYGRLLEQLNLTGDERAALLPGLLETRDADGAPWLFTALESNEAAGVEAYGALLKALALTPEERAAFLCGLLEARDAQRVPGLFIGLQENRAAAIEAYGALLKGLALTPEERTAFLRDVLEARDADEIPGLFMAVAHSCAAAIEAYGKLLNLLSPDQAGAMLETLGKGRLRSMALDLANSNTKEAYYKLENQLTIQAKLLSDQIESAEQNAL
ncbi:hypothetical protein FHS82_002719 [Pseudochelatococcus lubricantis]|uniref:ShET2 enterotoxin N-terminal domain-containing protein n=1 Tax=Pseudochelatococcus lubricantis TaxID=1538102 RepID=A0ABX0V0Z1_9HYPH|nr:ShET2/EspL2 family type III secretion system effector toxin [Pseudochelatococcus lubricantis]NIJ58864.1 hypothetical protein [Pseudochelatococcus lubricantis]